MNVNVASVDCFTKCATDWETLTRWPESGSTYCYRRWGWGVSARPAAAHYLYLSLRQRQRQEKQEKQRYLCLQSYDQLVNVKQPNIQVMLKTSTLSILQWTSGGRD